MAHKIDEVVDWDIAAKSNHSPHPTGPEGLRATRISLTVQEIMGAIARWRDAGLAGGAGGSDTQIQYNNAGAFGGIAEFIYDDTSPTTSVLMSMVPNAALTSGDVLNITSSLAGKTGQVVSIAQAHASSNAYGLYITQNGPSVAGLRVDASHAGARAGYFYSNIATRTEPVVDVVNDNATGAGIALRVVQDQAADGLQALSQSAAARAALFYSNVATRTLPLVSFINDNATGVGPALSVSQDQGGNAFESFVNNAAARAGLFYSNAATRTIAVLDVVNDNAVGAGVALRVQNDQSGAAIDVIGNIAVTGTVDGKDIGVNGMFLNEAQEHTSQKNFNATVLTDAASITWNLNTNQVCSVTLTGNRTLANPTNQVDGSTYILKVIQDGTGTRTLAYGTAYKWPGGTAPVLSTGINEYDYFTFISDGTNMNGVIQQAFA